MTNPALIFLAIAVGIIALAIFLTRAFRKTIARDKRHQDINGDERDGDAAATWSGIDKGTD